jgi:F0F1-type ATP synthase membrane subunit b/b'
MSFGTETHHAPAHWGISEWYALAHVTIIAAIIYFSARTAIRLALKSRKEDVEKKLIETRKELSELNKSIELSRKELSEIEKTKAQLISKVEEEGKKLKDNLVLEAEATARRILEDARLAKKMN